MALHQHNGEGPEEVSFPPLYARRNDASSFPKLRIPDGPMDPEVAEHLIRDELLLDGSARLNLATFVTTWMEPNAARLMSDTAEKNIVDKDEYPRTAELERRCVHMLVSSAVNSF